MTYIYIGKLTSTHGLRGELKLKSSFWYMDKVLQEGFVFYVGDEKERVNLLKYRNHNGTYLLTFKDYEDINLVESFRNKDIYVLREDVKLNNNQYLYEDYIDLKAYYNDKEIGTVKDIVDCGNNNYVFYVVGEKEILIPLNDKFIDKIVLNDKICFKELEGLLDAN